MTVFLTGGGDQEFYQQLDRDFLAALGDRQHVLVVPTAADFDDWPHIIERLDEAFRGDAKLALQGDMAALANSPLDAFDGVYIEGGNTFDLIKALSGSPAFSWLQEFYKAGGVIYGDSAGAIVLGDNTQTAFWGNEGDDNDAALQQFRGLKLVPDLAIHCHYQRGEDDDQAQDHVYASGLPVICLAEETGMRIDRAGLMTVYGDAPAAIFTMTGRRLIDPGDDLGLDQLYD